MEFYTRYWKKIQRFEFWTNVSSFLLRILKLEQNTGKVIEICQLDDVGTM